MALQIDKIENLLRIYEILQKKNILGKASVEKNLIGNETLYVVSIEYFQKRKKLLASGVDYDYEKAYLKALMEAIEWYTISSYSMKDVSYSKFEESNTKMINPAKFRIIDYVKAKMKNNKINFSNSIFLNWTNVYSVTEKKDFLIPAQVIYSDYEYKKEELLRISISTGSAAGFSEEECIVRGILEIIERDNFSLFWLTKKSPNIIDYFLDKTLALKIKNLSDKLNTQVFILDLSYDFPVYTIGTLMINPKSRIAVIGLGSEFELIKAIEKSLLEAFKLFKSQEKLIGNSNLPKKTINSIKLKDIFLSNRFKWLVEKPLGSLLFLLNGEVENINNFNECKINCLGISDMSRVLLETVNKNNDEIFIKKYPSLESEVLVRKIIVPRMVPLFISELLPFKFQGRLKKFALENNITKLDDDIIAPPFF